MPIRLSNLPERPLIVPYLGGFNSTAMLIEFCRLGIKADLILFGDTRSWRPGTVEFVQRFSQWLQQQGQPAVVFMGKKHIGQPEGLEAECLRQKSLPALSYGHKSCALRHRSSPIDEGISTWAMDKPQALPVIKAISTDLSEERRSFRRSPNPRFAQFWHPLVEWCWDHLRAREVCAQAGWSPAHWTCFLCPASDRDAIQGLKNSHPELWARAIAVEKQATSIDGRVRGLGGLGDHSWEKLGDGDGPWTHFGLPLLPCECYDG